MIQSPENPLTICLDNHFPPDCFSPNMWCRNDEYGRASGRRQWHLLVFEWQRGHDWDFYQPFSDPACRWWKSCIFHGCRFEGRMIHAIISWISHTRTTSLFWLDHWCKWWSSLSGGRDLVSDACECALDLQVVILTAPAVSSTKWPSRWSRET